MIYCSAMAVLKFQNFRTRDKHFQFALILANEEATPGFRIPSVAKVSILDPL